MSAHVVRPSVLSAEFAHALGHPGLQILGRRHLVASEFQVAAAGRQLQTTEPGTQDETTHGETLLAGVTVCR